MVHPRTAEKRAVKILPRKGSTPAFRYARFLREVEIVRRLDHPCIVKIFEAGVRDDCYYYIMEYMPHGTLARLLREANPSPQWKIETFRRICEGMRFAHSRGIIHRDLKPGNILFRNEDQPVISDFGIAKITHGPFVGFTQSREMLGTPAYLAPEQRWNAKRADARSDIYALGAILYEMFMNFPPLGDFPWPWEVDRNFPGWLEPILHRCLALDPQNRYSDAADLQRAMHGPTQCRDGGTSDSQKSPALLAIPSGWGSQISFKQAGELSFSLRRATVLERLRIAEELAPCLSEEAIRDALSLYRRLEDLDRLVLIRIFGLRRVTGAVRLLEGELDNPRLAEAALESLGEIGSRSSTEAIRSYLCRNPDAALLALGPLARIGGSCAVGVIAPYLNHDRTAVREAAARALAVIGDPEALYFLRRRYDVEGDVAVRTRLGAAIEAALTREAGGSPDATLIET